MADEIKKEEIMSEEELDNVAGGATYIYYFPAVRGDRQGFKVVELDGGILSWQGEKVQ